MNPKLCWERPGVAWLQRAIWHLQQHRRIALEQNDAAAFHADEVSIRALQVFIELLQRDAQQRRRRQREETTRLRELRNQDAALLKRLADTEEFSLPLAA